jgi:hypothetical protein
MHVGTEDDVAAAATVPATGSALGDKLFPAETDAPPAAVTGLGENFDAIDKHGER